MDFIVKETCGLARKGVLRTNDIKVDTPLMFLGYSLGRGNPIPWKKDNGISGYDVEAVMVNAIDVNANNKKHSKDQLIHKLIDFENLVMMDSGGYQFQQLDLKIEKDEIIRVQTEMKPNIAIPLDFPLKPGIDMNEILRRIGETKKSNIYWGENYKAPFIPVFHGYKVEQIKEQIEDFGESKYIALGSFVPILMYSNRKKIVDLILDIRKIYPESFIHCFGVSYLLSFLFFYLGVDSVDSMAWIHNARFGSIHLTNTGPRAIAYRSKNEKRPAHKTITREEFEKEECSCPVCSTHEFEQLKQRGIEGLKLRGIHNGYVYQRGVFEFRNAVMSHKVFDLVYKVFKNSGLYYLFKYAQKRLSNR